MDAPIDETFNRFNNPSFLDTARRIAINTSLSTEEAMRALGQAMDRGLKWSDLSVSGLPPFTKEQAMGGPAPGGTDQLFRPRPAYMPLNLGDYLKPQPTPDAAEVARETYRRIDTQMRQNLARANWEREFFQGDDTPTAITPPPVAPPPPLPPRYKRLIRE